MPTDAKSRSGEDVDSREFASDVWARLQRDARPGDFLMSCCGANAALKTSINGVQFFAHYAGECDTAPETAWHRAGKSAVVSGLRRLRLDPVEEAQGKSGKQAWRADVAVRAGERHLVFELQRSPQTLKEFTRRQERYAAAGMECYWLAPLPVCLTAFKAGAKLKFKREWNGILPKNAFGSIPEVPLALLQVNEDSAMSISFGGGTGCSLDEWLRAVVEQRYTYWDERWHVRGKKRWAARSQLNVSSKRRACRALLAGATPGV